MINAHVCMCVCRPEASKDGIKKAKAAVKKGLIRTIHPLIQGCDGVRCNSLLAEKAVCMYVFFYLCKRVLFKYV